MRPGPRTRVLNALLAGVLLIAAATPNAPLADAAMRGDLDEVRELLAAGADVDAAQGDGMTALHWAAELGAEEMVKVLLEAGARVDAGTRLGDFTPLHVAAERTHPGVVRALLDAGANPNAVSSLSGEAPLHHAAKTGNVEIIEALLDHGADVDARESAWLQTPLMFAAAWNRPEAARLLVDRGADFGATSDVLDVAHRAERDALAQAARDSVLAEFRAASADPVLWQPTPEQVQEAVRAARKFEALEPAPIERPDWERLQAEEATSPDYAEQVGLQGGFTPLLHAVREGNVEVTRVLLELGATINQVSTGDRTSPLLVAMINGHYDLGLELLARGADPNIVSDAGTGPLWAVINTYWAPKARNPQRQDYRQQQATHLDAMKALLDAGAEPNARLSKHLYYVEFTFARLGIDTWGATPFWRAAHALDVDAMKLLVSYGADPDIPSKAPPGDMRFGDSFVNPEKDPSGLRPSEPGGPGVYPIHVATGFGTGRAPNSHRHVPDGWIPAVRYLVEDLGADVNRRDFRGATPLHHAAGRGNNELIEFLLEKGATLFDENGEAIVSRSGQNAADMANGPDTAVPPYPETLALLDELGVQPNFACAYCGELQRGGG